MYLEYRSSDKLVVAIHETMPAVLKEGHAVVTSEEHKPGDEYEYVITVMEVVEGMATSLASVRQNPKVVIEQLIALREEVSQLKAQISAK